MTARDHASGFTRGFADGYRSVLGPLAAVPAAPPSAAPAGTSDYEWGHEKGVEMAQQGSKRSR